MILCPTCLEGPVHWGYDGLYCSCRCGRLNNWIGDREDPLFWVFSFSSEEHSSALYLEGDVLTFSLNGNWDLRELVPDEGREEVVLRFLELARAAAVLDS